MTHPVKNFSLFNTLPSASHVRTLCVALAAGLGLGGQAAAQTTQPVNIQSFSATADGELVTPYLPMYKLSNQYGKLYITGLFENGKWVTPPTQTVFNSAEPQSVVPKAQASCTIRNLNWAAYYTTYYVAFDDGAERSLYVINACGKSAISYQGGQYPNTTGNNFVNHAQIAANALNLPLGSTVSVIAAGEIDIIDGKIVYMDNCSGHFKPTTGATLAYMDQFVGTLENPGPLSLTVPLLNAVTNKIISSATISANFISQISAGNRGDTPQRWLNTTTGYEEGIRAGTSNCTGYTTVFLPVNQTSSSVDLVGGLMIYKDGPINVFQTTVNALSWKNLKSMYLDRNYGLYHYQADVVTDLHFWNNALQLYFTDETEDRYSLSIHNFSYNHEVDYNSAEPNIKKITIQQYFSTAEDVTEATELMDAKE